MDSLKTSPRYPPRGLSALRVLAGLPAGAKPLRASLCREGEWRANETLPLSAGGGPRAQRLCLACLLGFQVLERGAGSRAVWPFLARPVVPHCPACPMRLLPAGPSSRILLRARLAAPGPCTRVVRLLVFHHVPNWNLCKPCNIRLGKRKMNVPSIFPVPIPSSTKKTLNEEGRGASYQRQVCSENL